MTDINNSYQEIEDEFRTYDNSTLKSILNELSPRVEMRKGLGWALAHSSLMYLLMVPAISGISRAIGHSEISDVLMNYSNHGLSLLVGCALGSFFYNFSGDRKHEYQKFKAANEIIDAREKSGVEFIKINN